MTITHVTRPVYHVTNLSRVVLSTDVGDLAALDELAVDDSGVTFLWLEDRDGIVREEEGNYETTVHVDGTVGVETREES